MTPRKPDEDHSPVLKGICHERHQEICRSFRWVKWYLAGIVLFIGGIGTLTGYLLVQVFEAKAAAAIAVQGAIEAAAEATHEATLAEARANERSSLVEAKLEAERAATIEYRAWMTKAFDSMRSDVMGRMEEIKAEIRELHKRRVGNGLLKQPANGNS